MFAQGGIQQKPECSVLDVCSFLWDSLEILFLLHTGEINVWGARHGPISHLTLNRACIHKILLLTVEQGAKYLANHSRFLGALSVS